MELNEGVIKSWLDRINEWARLGIIGKSILEITDSLMELKYFLSELKKVLTKSVCITFYSIHFQDTIGFIGICEWVRSVA